MEKVRRGEPPQVFGDGSETKHFVYVGDLARANRMAFESAATDVAVNTSGPAPVTTLQLVELVTELAGGGPGPEIRRQRARQGAADLAAAPSASRMRRPWRRSAGSREVDMREGLRRLIAWRDSQRGEGRMSAPDDGRRAAEG